MAAENMNSKISIKHMLFTRAIPNYIVPVPGDGYKTFACTDCGDRFLFKSSYEDHVNRKSVAITYMCRHCHQVKYFKNRCNLLSHIRSHVFKFATINVSDLRVEPLPLSEFEGLLQKNQAPSEDDKQKRRNVPFSKKSICVECKEDITQTGTLCKDIALHCMRYTNQIHTCPICLFVMPTKCAYKIHIRIHNKNPPYLCPECGIYLTTKVAGYPFSHSCDGFNMMRATARIKCPVKDCSVYHPSNYISHMLNQHTKMVFKCTVCIVACFNKEAIEKHLANHNSPSKKYKYTIFYQCYLCPGRLVLSSQIETHLQGHCIDYVHPCWTCGAVFKKTVSLLQHSAYKTCKKITNDNNIQPNKGNMNAMYRVVKRCDRCKLYFTYKCKYDEISCLPNECPYKCSPGDHVMEVSRTEQSADECSSSSNITCHLCQNSVSNNWEEIKKHYADLHKEHQCLDGKVIVEKLNVTNSQKYKKSSKPVGIIKIKKIRKRTRMPKKLIEKESEPAHHGHKFVCIKCCEKFAHKQDLEKHMVVHRDPCTAYQCLECGQCFVVKPSFTTHLLVEHGLSEVDEYIKSKPCYNEDAFIKYRNTVVSDEPLLENQCNICRDKFENNEDLEKHFRVHGMAFLMKNAKNNSP